MKIKLDSDFSNYYDHWFCGSHDNPDKIFKRIAKSVELDRIGQFKLMEDVGFSVVYHAARPEALYPACEDPSKCGVVVYFDPYAHQGEGKLLTTLEVARAKYSECACSLFIGRGQPSRSRRLLCVGDRTFWVDYVSRDDWRSNCGDTEAGVLSEGLSRAGYFREAGPDWRPDLLRGYPLWAVDFVLSKDARLVAIDFNSAPGLDGIGLDETVPAKEVFEELRNYMLLNSDRATI